MKPEIQEKWVAALRSGDYKQTAGHLKDGGGFCCLGVLTDIYASECNIKMDNIIRGNNSSLSKNVRKWAGFTHKNNMGNYKTKRGEDTSLADKNDGGLSFKRIACIIEKVGDRL